MPRLPLLLALVSAALGLASCGDVEQRPEEPKPIASHGAPPFTPPSYPAGRSIDTILAARLDGGSARAFVVASRNDSGDANAGFDWIEVFGYDSVARRWRSLLVDSLESARRIGLRDITGDGHEEIVIGLASGGNDPVASSGMNVYSAHGDGLRRVFRSTWQDPHIDTLEGISGPVITMRRELWPLFAPRADALVYIDDVFGYRDGRFRSVLAEASQYFRSRAERSVAAYGPLRTAVVAALDSARRAAASRRDSIVAAGATEMPEVEEARDSLSYDHELRLFQTTALVVLNRSKAGDMRGARAFWMQQRQFLRSVLPPEQFDELATFCERLIIGG